MILALTMTLAAAPATAAEAGLRLSPTLTRPAPAFSEEERALLRAEYHAAQSAADEADIVGDMLRRIHHINDMIADIRNLLASMPAAATTPAKAPAALPAPPASADEDAPSATSGPTIALRALMASVIIFLFWLLGKRHSYIKAQRRKASAAADPSGG